MPEPATPAARRPLPLGRVQIVFVNGDDRRELDVRVNNPSATVADLVQALDPAAVSRAASNAHAAQSYAPLTLMVGDRVVDPEFELGEAGLHEGVVVQITEAQSGPWGAPPPPPPVLAERELAVVNGLDAGRRGPIAPGSLTLGRAAGSEIVLHDRTISRRHARLDVAPTGQATGPAPGAPASSSRITAPSWRPASPSSKSGSAAWSPMTSSRPAALLPLGGSGSSASTRSATVAAGLLTRTSSSRRPPLPTRTTCTAPFS